MFLSQEKENTEYQPDCTFKVDDDGFFVSWKSEGKEGDVLELSTVNDVRPGEVPQVHQRAPIKSFVEACDVTAFFQLPG